MVGVINLNWKANISNQTVICQSYVNEDVFSAYIKNLPGLVSSYLPKYKFSGNEFALFITFSKKTFNFKGNAYTGCKTAKNILFRFFQYGW